MRRNRAFNLWMAAVAKVQPLIVIYPTDCVNCSRYVKCHRTRRAFHPEMLLLTWKSGGFCRLQSPVRCFVIGACSRGSSTNACNCAIFSKTSSVYCISVGYCIILFFTAGSCRYSFWAFFFSVFGSLCVSCAFGATGGCFWLIYAWMLNRSFAF